MSLKLYGTGSRGHIDEQTTNDSSETKSEKPKEAKQEDAGSVEEETTDGKQDKEKKANKSAQSLI